MTKKQMKFSLFSILSLVLLSQNSQATNKMVLSNDDDSFKKAITKITIGATTITAGAFDLLLNVNRAIPVTPALCDNDISSVHPQEIASEMGFPSIFIRSPTEHLYCQYQGVTSNSIGLSHRTAYQGMTGDAYTIHTTAYPEGYLYNIYFDLSLIMGGAVILGAGFQDLYRSYYKRP